MSVSDSDSWVQALCSQVYFGVFGRNNQGTLHCSGMVGLFVGYTKQTRIQVDLKEEWFISIPRIDKSRSGMWGITLASPGFAISNLLQFAAIYLKNMCFY